MLARVTLPHILRFLSIAEASTLAACCKTAKNTLDEFHRFWAERCIRSLTSQLIIFQ